MSTLHLWEGPVTAESTKGWTEGHLEASRRKIAELLAVTGERTVENTLRPYDGACWHSAMAAARAV